MALYNLSTLEKKSILEREVWVHKEKGYYAIHEHLWRWGHITIETDGHTAPEIDLENEDGLDVNDLGYTVEIGELDDGCGSDWVFSDNMPDDIRETTANGYDEEMNIYMEEAGWEHENTELWFSGPLELKPAE